jgi:hypothetical protein
MTQQIVKFDASAESGPMCTIRRKTRGPASGTIVKKKFWAILVLSVLPMLGVNGYGKNPLTIHLNGPSYSKHFWEMDRYLINWHMGVGVECEYPFGRRWRAGLHGHYMFKDSCGITGGCLIGDAYRLWMQPALILGVIKKREYFHGTPSFFGMPYLSVGYKFLGFNLVFIPKILHFACPILMVQVKLRVAR